MNSKKKTQPCGQCQDKISEQVTFSKQEKDAELPYHLLPKHIQQAMIINVFFLNEKSSAMFKLVVVSITSKYSNGSFKVSEGASQPFNWASVFRAKLIVALTFKQSIETQPIFQVIDVSVPNKNDLCSAFQMVVHGHNTFIKSAILNDSSFQLVVKFILISNSEGALVPSSMLFVGCNTAYGPAFGHKFAFGTASGQNFASGVASGHHFVSDTAFGQNFAAGMASGQNFASVVASGHKLTSGAASGHNLASGPAFGHRFASGAASDHHMASGPAFGYNFTSGAASGHNIAAGTAFGHNLASSAASGHNMASGLAFRHNFASGPASGQNLTFGRNKLFKLITAFGHSKLIKLIVRVGHTNSLVNSNERIGPKIQTQLIVKLSSDNFFDGTQVQEVGYHYSKIFLHFCKSYRTFCEEVLNQLT